MIAILDFGSQYTRLIARTIRQLEVYSIIVKHDIDYERLIDLNPAAIILSGGPSSVYAANALKCDKRILEMSLPILGICYGAQLLVQHYGGKVVPGSTGEYGIADMVYQGEGLFCNISTRKIGYPHASFDVWMSHGDKIIDAGEFRSIGSTADCKYAAIRHTSRCIYGLQFHPEVKHTYGGKAILRQFVIMSQDLPIWTMDNYLEEAILNIRGLAQGGKVICGMSGGVDSSVVSALLCRAIGSNAICVFVNNGLLREGEEEQVVADFQNYSKGHLEYVDASTIFLNALKGVVDPQEKRLIIGKIFVDVFQEVANSWDDIVYLAQGTLYPDVIESGGDPDGPATIIKHHHNVGGLPETLKLKLIEPLRDLFKDEVRALGCELGLPASVINRAPFPGPGLGVRVVGEITPERLAILRKADSILQFESKKIQQDSAQRFAILLPVNTVGVMGDNRTYESAIVIRSVETDDYMTAEPSNLSHAFLTLVSTRIVNEVKGVNRVLYDCTSKPPSTIEWE